MTATITFAPQTDLPDSVFRAHKPPCSSSPKPFDHMPGPGCLDLLPHNVLHSYTSHQGNSFTHLSHTLLSLTISHILSLLHIGPQLGLLEQDKYNAVLGSFRSECFGWTLRREAPEAARRSSFNACRCLHTLVAVCFDIFIDRPIFPTPSSELINLHALLHPSRSTTCLAPAAWTCCPSRFVQANSTPFVLAGQPSFLRLDTNPRRPHCALARA